VPVGLPGAASRRSEGVPASLPPDLAEAPFTTTVIETAQWYGWRVHHSRPARTKDGYRTAVQGHVGLPDLVLARGAVVLLAELKTAKGKPTADQRAWLAAAGVHGRLWRPRDWAAIVAELAPAA
jgi:hypothetical protein